VPESVEAAEARRRDKSAPDVVVADIAVGPAEGAELVAEGTDPADAADFVDEFPTVPPPASERRDSGMTLRWATADPTATPATGSDDRPGPSRPQRSPHWSPPATTGRQGPKPAEAARPGRRSVEPASEPPNQGGREPGDEPTREIAVLDSPPPAPRQHPRRRLVRTWAVVLAVAVLAVGGVALTVGLTASPSKTPPGTPVTGTSPGSSPGAIFGSLLARSATGHQLAEAAVARACQTALPGSASREALLGDLSRAEGMQLSVLAGLGMDRSRLVPMPYAGALEADLGAFARASVAADKGYGAWLADLQATGCYSAPTNDMHYVAAGKESLVAGVAKLALVSTWARVAPRYDLSSITAEAL